MIINKQQKWNDNVVYCVKKYVRNVWAKISNGKNVKILRLWNQTMVDENIKSIIIWKVGHSKRYDHVKNGKFENIMCSYYMICFIKIKIFN